MGGARIGTVGHIDHGKTTLTAAIVRVLARGGAPVTGGGALVSGAHAIEAQRRYIVAPVELAEIRGPKQNWKPRKYIGG